METIIQKFKALLKARKNRDVEGILKKCSLDEMRKIARVLNVHAESDFASVFVIWIISALDKRRFERDLLFNREKILATLVF